MYLAFIYFGNHPKLKNPIKVRNMIHFLVTMFPLPCISVRAGDSPKAGAPARKLFNFIILH